MGNPRSGDPSKRTARPPGSPCSPGPVCVPQVHISVIMCVTFARYVQSREPDMRTIKEIQSNGRTRYRFVIDVGKKKNGKRDQRTFTYDSREDAEVAMERMAAAVKDRLAVAKVKDEAAAEWIVPVELFKNGICHPMCLHAWGTEEEQCVCACGGELHGQLADHHLPAAWLGIRPVRSKKESQRHRARAIRPEVLARIGVWWEEAGRDLTWRYRRAYFVQERLAEIGMRATVKQIYAWVARLRHAP